MHKRFLTAILTTMLVFSSATAFAQAENAEQPARGLFNITLPDFTGLVKKVGPAVVNISTEKEVERRAGSEFFWNLPKGTPFEDFFKQFEPPAGSQPQTRKERSLGSGFLISEDGYIVTNNHVVENASAITINLEGKNNRPASYTAEIVGTDPETDLALLKIESDNPLPYLEFGNSQNLEVGEWVIAIGNPFGLDHSVTKGIISAKGRNIQAGPFDSFLQTDASINPGNSGGPLIDMQGKVIGINTAIIASGQGIGFAIPSNLAQDVINQLRTSKTVKRGWLGVQIQNVDEAAAQAMGLPEPIGALVGEVFAGEPADKAGIRPGDIILAVNGETVIDNSDLLRKVAALRPGTRIPVTVWRDGKELELKLTLGARDSGLSAQGAAPDKDGSGSREAALGISVKPVSKEEARALGYEGDGLLVVNVDEDGPAGRAGLRKGDILQTANLSPLSSAADLENIIRNDAAKKGAVMFNVVRRGQSFFLAVPLDKK